MPERWEREIARFNDVKPPARLRSRVGEGPHGDGAPAPPGRVQRAAAATVAIVVFIAAAALTYEAFNDRAPGTADMPNPLPQSTLELRCTPDGMEVLTPIVRTHPEGVRVNVVDAGQASDVIFGITGHSGIIESAGDDLASGSFVRPLFVGQNFAACRADRDIETVPPAAGWAPFQVVDPAPSNWASLQLPCPSPDWVAITGEVSAPNEADLLDSDLAMRLPQVRSSDVVEPAGYVMSPSNRSVRVVRGDSVLAWFNTAGPDASATWHLSGFTCPASEWLAPGV
jgi:hypothetical protein